MDCGKEDVIVKLLSRIGDRYKFPTCSSNKKIIGACTGVAKWNGRTKAASDRRTLAAGTLDQIRRPVRSIGAAGDQSEFFHFRRYHVCALAGTSSARRRYTSSVGLNRSR